MENGNVQTLMTSDIIFREKLYPRIETSHETVQKYASDLTVLPPIEVNQHCELIDGWHRWTAHRKAEAEEINAIVTETGSDADLLELAIERNAKHGMQLSLADKRKMAKTIYDATDLSEQGKKKERLAEILSVSLKTVQNWLSRTDKDNKEERNAKVGQMWLACYTEKEIADAVGISQQRIGELLPEYAKFRIPVKVGDFAEVEDDEERKEVMREEYTARAHHARNFDAPIYNIWKQQTKTDGSSHFGNTEVRWVDNLLYLYTQPFDIVIDPFAGGGSTIDICKERFRRYLASDRKPIIERSKEIRNHDLTEGVLKPPQWTDVKLVYLDPPYWKQAEGKYSDDPDDLANMPLEQFNDSLTKIIKAYAAKISDAYIALVMSPTQYAAPEKQFTDHIGDMLRAIKRPVDMRYSVPYESQQCSAQMVDWAKQNKQCLVLTREIVVWSIE